MTYDVEQLEKDFPMFKSESIRPSVIVMIDYKMWDDYDRDASGNYVLKKDAKPDHYRIGNFTFKTIDEMFIYIDLTYGSDVDIIVDDSNDANEVLKAWYEHQQAQLMADAS